MRLYVVIAPRFACDHLCAKLLGEGDTDRFRLAVGVIRANGDPQAVGLGEQDKLDFTACVWAGNLNLRSEGQKIGRDTVEDRRRLRRLDADLFQLADVLLQRGFVASGPAGDDELFELLHATLRR